jgi:hypothetical protein
MILRIARNIKFYLLVLLCVLSGFTQAFWLLSNYDATLPFGTIKSAFLTSFFYMLGQNIDKNFVGLVSPDLATVLLVLFMMVMIILMLNLLIALMGDAFSKVRELGLAVWRREQAAIIIEESFLLQVHNSYIPEYLHILKYTSDVGTGYEGQGVDENNPLINLVNQGKAIVTPFTELTEEDEKGMEEVD